MRCISIVGERVEECVISGKVEIQNVDLYIESISISHPMNSR